MSDMHPAASQHRYWVLKGVRDAASVPAIVLMSAFIGFAGLTREAGISLAEAVFMTLFVWALPAKVVLLGAIMSGTSLPATAFAVALSSIRLTPMVVTLLPELRAPGTRKWVLYLLSHFIAVTSWVLAMEKIRNVPRDMRTAWYGGLGAALLFVSTSVVAVTYVVAGALPPVLSAALLMLTPMYFLTSLWGSARETASYFAMAFGLVLGPLFHLWLPGFDLLAAGIVGGGAAWLLHRAAARRPRA